MKWINTKDRLPENTKSRPVIDKNGYAIASYYETDHKGDFNPYWIDKEGYHLHEVEKWQPIEGE